MSAKWVKWHNFQSNESTGVNIIKLKEQMYAASNANWKPIINTTIDGCWANLTSKLNIFIYFVITFVPQRREQLHSTSG